MDDNLQRVFSILMSTIIFFMLPLYIAFEKKDDISYALSLKITNNFVDEVKSKGYISKNMYDGFTSDLALTGNIYEIKMEHIAKKYYPAIYSYEDASFKKIDEKGNAIFDYSLYKKMYKDAPNVITESGRASPYGNLNFSYKLEEEIYTENQILRALEGKQDDFIISNYGVKTINDIPLYPNMYNKEGNIRYTMNIGDEFSVTIKNTNMTFATVLFNTLTFGANTGNVPTVYIDYGGTIENEDYKTNIIDTNKP